MDARAPDQSCYARVQAELAESKGFDPIGVTDRYGSL